MGINLILLEVLEMIIFQPKKIFKIKDQKIIKKDNDNDNDNDKEKDKENKKRKTRL